MKIPKIKKEVKAFLLSDSGNVTKNKVLKIGLFSSLLGIGGMSKDAFACHCSINAESLTDAPKDDDWSLIKPYAEQSCGTNPPSADHRPLFESPFTDHGSDGHSSADDDNWTCHASTHASHQDGWEGNDEGQFDPAMADAAYHKNHLLVGEDSDIGELQITHQHEITDCVQELHASYDEHCSDGDCNDNHCNG
ncbi:hypothetical protein HN587_06395 [Candidatus Woesearchaeota archaeon]|nr:hypothetical protein [Candidatus Woesearchaeota archaeon]